MVTEFNDWCFDESRQPGDTGIVYNEGSYTGYHVIYFVGTDAPYWQVQVRNAMKNADYTQWNNALVKDITATEASGMKNLVRRISKKDRPSPVFFDTVWMLRSLFMHELFLRTEMVLGQPALERLQSAHVAVFGLGGVGSYAAEILARSGVGELTLVDQDTVSVTNINRQLCALHSTVGQSKAEVTARRCRDISPSAVIHPICATYDAAHREDFFSARYDYIADCIDLVTCKLDLIQQAMDRRIPILSALGTGNKLDPTLLRVTDISQTSGCPLARVMRKELRSRGIRHLKVVFSPEQPAATTQLEAPSPGRRSVPASVPWVPSTAGILLAGTIVRDLIG